MINEDQSQFTYLHKYCTYHRNVYNIVNHTTLQYPVFPMLITPVVITKRRPTVCVILSRSAGHYFVVFKDHLLGVIKIILTIKISSGVYSFHPQPLLFFLKQDLIGLAQFHGLLEPTNPNKSARYIDNN